MTRTVRIARALVAGLVFVTASFHLWWGFPRTIVYLQGLGAITSQGIVPDPRPFLFVAFGVVLLLGPYLVTRDVVSLRRAYLAGVALMLLSFAFWIFWHETGHGAFLTGTPAPTTDGHTHGGVLYTIYDHYVTTPTEGIVKSVELLAAGLFGFLLRRDPAVRETERTESSAAVDSERPTSE